VVAENPDHFAPTCGQVEDANLAPPVGGVRPDFTADSQPYLGARERKAAGMML
jgi:hypothetical protein